MKYILLFILASSISLKSVSQCNLGLSYGLREIKCTTAGEIAVVADSGIKPYQFALDSMYFNNTNGRFTVSKGGNHTIYVQDSLNCLDSITIKLNEFEEFKVDYFSTERICNTNYYQVSYHVSGGVAPYYYKDPGQLQFPWGSYKTIQIILTEANYTLDSLSVADSRDCRKSYKPLVKPPSIFLIPDLCVLMDTLSLPNCSNPCNGQVVIHPINGNPPFTYSISPSATIQGDTISNLCGRTNYTLTVTSSNPSYTITRNIYLGEDKDPFSYVSSSVVCNASNGYFILRQGYSIHTLHRSKFPDRDWMATNNNSTNLSGGFYYKLIYTYNSDCIDSTIFLINSSTNLPLPTNSIQKISPSDSNSYDGEIIVLQPASPIYSIFEKSTNVEFQNTTGHFKGLKKGYYTVSTGNNSNCITSLSTDNFLALDSLEINILTKSNVTCNDLCNGSVTVKATGKDTNITYTIKPNTVCDSTQVSPGTFINLNSTNYTITATDGLGATIQIPINITQPSKLFLWNTGGNNPSCNSCNGTLVFNPTGGTSPYTYSISPNNGTQATPGNFTNLCSGNYTVTVTDVNGCSSFNKYTIYGHQILQAYTQIINNINCINDSSGQIKLSASGGVPPYSYSINPPSSISNIDSSLFVGLTENVYTLMVSDNNFCTDTSIVTMSNIYPHIDSVLGIPESCEPGYDGKIIIQTSNSPLIQKYSLDKVNWVDSSSFLNYPKGNYNVYVINSQGCLDSAQVSIPFNNDLKIKDFSFISLICYGDNSGSLILPIDSNQYVLQPSVPNYSNLSAGIYTLTAYTPRGCSGDTIFQISEPPLLTLNTNILHSTYGDCHGEVQVTAQGGTPPYTFLAEPSNFVNISDSGTLHYLCNTQYEVMVRDKHGCEQRQQIFIPYQDLDGDDFAIYPNPAQNEFNFIFSRNVDVVLTLSDISGRVLYDQVYIEKNKVSLPVSHLSNGVYFVTLNFDGQKFVRKLEVRH